MERYIIVVRLARLFVGVAGIWKPCGTRSELVRFSRQYLRHFATHYNSACVINQLLVLRDLQTLLIPHTHTHTHTVT